MYNRIHIYVDNWIDPVIGGHKQESTAKIQYQAKEHKYTTQGEQTTWPIELLPMPPYCRITAHKKIVPEVSYEIYKRLRLRAVICIIIWITIQWTFKLREQIDIRAMLGLEEIMQND